MNRLHLLTTLLLLISIPHLWGQPDPCDPPLVASISASGPVCAGEIVSIQFNLPDDDGDAYDVTYQIGGDIYLLSGIIDGHIVDHIVTSSTTAGLLMVVNNDDDDDECFTEFNQTIPITVSEPNLVISSQVNPTCGQNNGSITATASNGIPPYRYSLNSGPLQNIGTFTNLSAGDYIVLAQDNLGCTVTETVSLSDSNSPDLAISNQDDPDCGQDNGSLTVIASGIAPPFQYSLNGGAFQSTGIFLNLSAGGYTVLTQDATGCTASIETSLISPNAPILTITNQTNPGCGQSNGSIVANAGGGTQPYQFSIDGTVFQSSSTFNGLPAGSYQILVKDAANCIGSESVTLTDPGASLPQANIVANETQSCSASTVFQLLGNLPPGTTGFWTSDDLQNPTPSSPLWTINNVPTGSTNISWTLTAPGCPNYDAATIVLNVLPPPKANSDGIFTIAEGDDAEEMVLQNDVLPAPVVPRIIKFPSQGTASFNSQNGLEYQPNASAKGLDTIIYEICYTECSDVCDTASVYFQNLRNEDPCVIEGDTSNVFTNGLTPNGDGNNDLLVFRVVSVEDCEINYAKSEIIIYNRWGDIVFEASPYNNDWDGTNRNGNDLPPGVYYFVLRVTLDKVYSQFGSVILLR